MYLDEVLHMDNRECLVLLRGQNALKLYKITPEEFPAYSRLKDAKVSDHIPCWRKAEEENRKTAPPERRSPKPEEAAPSPPQPEGQVPPAEKPGQAPGEGEGRPRPSFEPQFSYGLMGSKPCGLEIDGTEDTGDPGEDAPYGALELMEMMPEDIGGPQG